MAQARAVWTAESMDPFFGGYKEHLALLGMAPATVDYRLRVAEMLGIWVVDSGARLQSLDEDVVEGFVRGRKRATYAGTTYRASLAPLVAFLRLEDRIPARPPDAPPVEGTAECYLQQWAKYLLEERGNGAITVNNYVALGRKFLSTFELDGPPLPVERISAESVVAFVLARKALTSIGQLKNDISALRSLLRFLHGQGLVGDLAEVIPAVFSHRDSGVPKALKAEVVEDITRAIGDHPGTRFRNLAMLALLSGLGLRAKEVVDLMLEDIDWRAGTLLVRGKGGYRDTMPLPLEVGEALAEYLEHDTHRGPGERHLFHTAIGPYGPLGTAGLIGAVKNASVRTGHGRTGTHRFRHTIASRTLNAGATMEEVSQLLRHRSLDSTSIYAKVDFERLNLVVRPWPGATSMAWTGGAS